MLLARGIVKSYGSLRVLKGVDVRIRSGEIVTIAGSSGAGKSTLLHILGTLDKPDEGEVELDGTRIDNLKGARMAAFRNRHMGFVFQFHHLLPEFTALENVCMPAWIAGRPVSEAEARARELLGMLGLSDRTGHKPDALSGGEQQRVAVARALVNAPGIVFADEPTGNLDSGHARELHELFLRLRDGMGQTFLIVTHNRELAELGDRILHMRDGRMVSEEVRDPVAGDVLPEDGIG